MRLLLSINRAQSIEHAKATVDLAIELFRRPSNKFVVGIEFSGNRYASDFNKFRATLERARQGGLPISSLHIAEIDKFEETQQMINFRPRSSRPGTSLTTRSS